MADIENWQSKCPTIRERTKFIFNNELLSDVKFVVPVSNGDSESNSINSKKVIPAHKFLLAIGSPVFFTMFYGQVAETTDSIELPDCEYESLLELFRYLYSDKVNLSGNNVMQVLYLANKYMVPSLAGLCTEYLRDNLDPSNVFCVLPHANKFEDKDLEKHCWKVIEEQTQEAVTSDEFVTVERSLVTSLVTRDVLTVNEVELFKAVDCWATKECERQGITPDGDAKRRILGEEIVKGIRFPLMSLKEFSSVVADCNILTKKELVYMMKFYGDVLISTLPFSQDPRIKPRHDQWCFRFGRLISSAVEPGLSPFLGGDGVCSNICVSTNKDINLHGVQLFGSEGGKYKVSIEVKNIANHYSLVKQSGSYLSEKDEICDYYVFDVLFAEPFCLQNGETYKISSYVKGPPSWYGQGGKTFIESSGVLFMFSKLKPRQLTDVNKGQFPALIFTLQ